MKKLLLPLLLVCTSLSAQITFESTHTAPNVAGMHRLEVIHLSSSGYKYIQADTSQIIIYDLNHTVYRTITIPNQSGIYSPTFRAVYVSEELFDVNPNNIEYMICYVPVNSNETQIRVYNETGTLLFSRDTFNLQMPSGLGAQQAGIAYTSGGTKMILTHPYTGASEVYSLPGTLPCNECSGGVISGIQPQTPSTENQQQLGNPYPNPTNGTTTIPYALPAESSSGTIIIYDMAGREVKRYTVTKAFASLELFTADLAEGTYSYSLEAGGTIFPGKKFVVVK